VSIAMLPGRSAIPATLLRNAQNKSILR